MLAEPPGRTLEDAGNGIPRLMAATCPARGRYRTRLIEDFGFLCFSDFPSGGDPPHSDGPVESLQSGGCDVEHHG